MNYLSGKRLAVIFLAVLVVSLQHPAYGWDSVGHRLSAAVALTYLSEEKQELLLQLLQQHPRYQADFVDSMPASVKRGNTFTQRQWLLGQAAFWPDLARRLPRTQAARYSRPSWHYIDGAWLRGAASSQGNLYLGTGPFPDIEGAAANTIETEQQAHNVVTALDLNARILADTNRRGAERAVALCWVLHLIGDIHQPLHAGSAYSASIFASGDRGGNGINTVANVSGSRETRNLHARWDGALASGGVTDNLADIIKTQGLASQQDLPGIASDWTQWLAESRNLLLTTVYSDAIKAAIVDAEQHAGTLTTLPLDSGYIRNMQRIARQRLGLAGWRAAIWIENSL